MNAEKIRQEIGGLVEKYNRVVEEKRVSKYNEETTKAEFIEPLFEALGWDVRNKFHEDEVTREEKVSKGRVDYGFRINGIPKFFLEAKSLGEDLEEKKYIAQAINYAWHKGCTWAILTNFEYVKIYNAEVKTESPWQTHLKTIPCREFLDRFNELWLLSKESFEQGLLDKEAEKWGKKAKKVSVDKQLLADFTRFRELLSKNIIKLNQSRNLTEDDLDESVQRILDRLIFIRNCEDRELEAKTLISSFREWESRGRGHLIKSLREVFAYFDKTYNSKLFQQHLCDDLEIDNEVLHEIIEGLYYTKDRSVSYDFSAIEADVLGNIYEQYLGHILKKSEKRAKLTENHAHRKEHGIYYTPTYIVDYIVKNTVREYCKDKTLAEISKIRILDPACGSGSFLIKAFDELYSIAKERIKSGEKSGIFKELRQDGELYLGQKFELVFKNIFGVDLDKKAVEITQLSLLLKLLENEGIGHKGGRVLPIIQNIKNGNSLIDDEAVAGDKAFKWEEEFKEGGFDVVIGNPPWVESKRFEQRDKQIYEKYFLVAKKQYDLFTLFIERGLQKLKDEGLLGFIVPDRFISNLDYQPFREFLLGSCKILKIIHLGDDVFPEVNMPSAIIIIRKEKSDGKRDNNLVEYAKRTDKILSGIHYYRKAQKEFSQNEGFVFSIFSTEQSDIILKKIRSDSVNFGEIVNNARGVEIGKNSEIITDRKVDKNHVKILVGEDIDRYTLISRLFIRLNETGVDYKDPELYKGPKILIRKTGLGIRAVLDTEEHYVIQVIYIFKTKRKDFDERYLLALLNSKLMQFYYYSVFGEKDRKTFPHLTQGKVLQLPIKQIPEPQQQPLITLVDRMLSLNNRLNEIGDKRTDERARVEEEIRKTDAEIDELVYGIYGITEEEKKIIEASLK